MFTLRARSNEFTIDIKPPYNDDSMLTEPKLKKTSATIIEIEPWYIITLNTFDVHHEAKNHYLNGHEYYRGQLCLVQFIYRKI